MGTEVRRISLDDVERFMVLQDEFVLEHHTLTQKLYGKVTLADWQHCLLCPERIMQEQGGREKQIIEMVKQENKIFRHLHVLIAGGTGEEVGYIMFHVHKTRRKHEDDAPASYIQVKQLFVRSGHRKRGLGTLLLENMQQVAKGSEAHDLRLSVLDLNKTAFNWYRSRGFGLTSVVWEYLGPHEDAHLVVYKVMQRLQTGESEKSDKAILFGSEVIGEVVSIKYPDGSGPFDVTIRGWCASERLHIVDSKGLSSWKGESFTDHIDFNEAFTAGRARFHRILSLVMRDVEMTKLLVKEAKAQRSKKQEPPETKRRRT